MIAPSLFSSKVLNKCELWRTRDYVADAELLVYGAAECSEHVWNAHNVNSKLHYTVQNNSIEG